MHVWTLEGEDGLETLYIYHPHYGVYNTLTD